MSIRKRRCWSENRCKDISVSIGKEAAVVFSDAYCGGIHIFKQNNPEVGKSNQSSGEPIKHNTEEETTHMKDDMESTTSDGRRTKLAYHVDEAQPPPG